jgi:hypothetical protein
VFEQAPEWVSQSPRIRRLVVKLWRAFLRVQRATLARVVLVAWRHDDCVLGIATDSGELRLPSLELDGWEPVGLQVQNWLDDLLHQPSSPQLKIIDGTPGRDGVTFLYSARVSRSLRETGLRWLEPEFASSVLSVEDRRLLRICRPSLRHPAPPD